MERIKNSGVSHPLLRAKWHHHLENILALPMKGDPAISFPHK